MFSAPSSSLSYILKLLGSALRLDPVNFCLIAWEHVLFVRSREKMFVKKTEMIHTPYLFRKCLHQCLWFSAVMVLYKVEFNNFLSKQKNYNNTLKPNTIVTVRGFISVNVSTDTTSKGTKHSVFTRVCCWFVGLSAGSHKKLQDGSQDGSRPRTELVNFCCGSGWRDQGRSFLREQFMDPDHIWRI